MRVRRGQHSKSFVASGASVGVSRDNIGQLAPEECYRDSVWAKARDFTEPLNRTHRRILTQSIANGSQYSE